MSRMLSPTKMVENQNTNPSNIQVVPPPPTAPLYMEVVE